MKPDSTRQDRSIWIRPAGEEDWPAIWSILEPILRAGETYALDRNLSQSDARMSWSGADRRVYVATMEIREARGPAVVGTYYLKANQGGGGAHVANCGYAVAPDLQGLGIARAMAEHSLCEAATLGFSAIQFNFVVETNRGALHLWDKLGFRTVGRLPKAFAHPSAGLVDALVLWRDL